MRMNRTIFTPEHEMFREAARKWFQNEVAPHGERWREQGYVDPEMFRKAGDQGYLLMWADEKYGGLGIEDVRYEQVLIEENRRYGDSGFYVPLHSRIVGSYLRKLATEEQKERYLPGCIRGETILGVAMTEAGAGSDLGAMRTRAEDAGDHWLLNGSKTYISNGQIGNLFVVAARTVPGQRYGIGLFLVEAGMDGFRRGRRLKKIGLKSQDTSELFFDNCRVPKANTLGDPARGFGALMQCLAEERLLGSISSVADAQVAFDLTLDFVREREVFGRPLGTFQNTRFKMAEMRTRIDATQVFVDHCVMEHNADRLSADAAAEVKLLTSELEGWVMDECVQLHGGAGYMEEYRIARMYTDARVSRIFAGSSEIMKEIIGRALGLDDRKLPGA
jgi:acyl-CoA dehydrogenase